MAVSLNGEEVYVGHITMEPGKRKEVAARLRQGWNVLVFKANHCTWQWQCAVDLAPVGEDVLDDSALFHDGTAVVKVNEYQ